MKTVNYYRKDVYGKTLMYLSDPADVKAFAKLTGKRTITSNDMDALASWFGATFVETLAPSNL